MDNEASDNQAVDGKPGAPSGLRCPKFLKDVLICSLGAYGGPESPVGTMAMGFIIVAAVRIGRKVVKDILTVLLMVFGGVVTFISGLRGSFRLNS